MAKSNDKKLRREMAAKKEQKRTKMMTAIFFAILAIALIVIAFNVVQSIMSNDEPDINNIPNGVIDDIFIDNDQIDNGDIYENGTDDGEE